VYERIKKLEREGIIDKYVVLLIKEKSKRICRFLSPKTNPTHKEFVTKFESEVQLKEVLECYHVSGDYDYILKIVVRDMEAYREF
jgi:Lrp/AsnC family leucine-responsive transcriptional regulator